MRVAEVESGERVREIYFCESDDKDTQLEAHLCFTFMSQESEESKQPIHAGIIVRSSFDWFILTDELY